MSEIARTEETMRSRLTAHRFALAGACVASVIALSPASAAAGEFAVANCQADPINFSTRAFDDFATRGMTIRRACDPEGPGLRGLITSNVVRGGRVQRGAVAMATISAPTGTRFTSFRWAGTARRRDCRYALQLYAEAPDIQPIAIKNVRANQRCPRAARAQQAGYRSRTFTVTGATRIVQRVICVGGHGRKSCSARGSNYLRTYEAEVGIADVLAPTATIVGDTPLARGEWVRGTQPLNYDASDNVGVRMAHAIVAGQTGGSQQRPCAFAAPERTYADRVPCPNGPGQINVNTTILPEGTQPLVVQAQDPAGNIGDSPAVTARIDNTPPGRVDVSVEGGQTWRNTNDFAVAWANPPEVDRAPIVAAGYTLCPVGAGSCGRGEQAGAELSRFGVSVPAPGEWTVSLWRRDAAGNETEEAASVPVTLRYDPEPPQLGFEPPSASDPTLVAVQVTDRVSGLADGAIEISPSGSGTWQALPTQRDGSRLLARIDDVALPAGGYLLRARASDQARNEASTDRRLDGQPMALTLPIRIVSTMQAGFERQRMVRRTIRRRGKRRQVRRPVTVLTPTARVPTGERAQVAGRLVNRDGQGIAGAEVHVLSSSPISPEQLVAVLQTDGEGHYRYTATGSTNRTLRFTYAGSPLVLPAQSAIKMSVPALTSLRVSR
ncbi:MAG: hypothetical protein H0U86_15415, partial [Chloroflexi bacterium]|nr:hypothetical protein [Chloroflexota bacterium]